MATHFTPIPTGTAVANTADTFNGPLQELDDAILALENPGASDTGQTNIKLDDPPTLTIASDAITRTQVWHYVDTEGGAASDNLATISGGSEGQLLIIQIINASHAVTVKHNTGNIYLQNGQDIVMNSLYMLLFLLYNSDLSRWVQINPNGFNLREAVTSTLVPINQVQVPDRTLIGSTAYQRRLAVQPDWEVSNQFMLRAAAATIQPIGVAAPTIANTPANANNASGSWVTLPTTTSSGNLGGFVSATFNLIRRAWNPVITFIVQTDPTGANFDNQRDWVGIISADITNVDTIAGATEFAGFRYSTVAGDTGWRPVTKDASTQNVGTAIGSIAANTVYKLQIRVDSANSTIYFSVNDSAEQALVANLPAAATDLGYLCRCITQTTAVRLLQFKSMSVKML